jgi:hypothetical protein
VVVTSRENNWDSQQTRIEQATGSWHEPREAFYQFKYLDSDGRLKSEVDEQVIALAREDEWAAVNDLLHSLKTLTEAVWMFFKGIYPTQPFFYRSRNYRTAVGREVPTLQLRKPRVCRTFI